MEPTAEGRSTTTSRSRLAARQRRNGAGPEGRKQLRRCDRLAIVVAAAMEPATKGRIRR
jgi:hypothetical protein